MDVTRLTAPCSECGHKTLQDVLHVVQREEEVRDSDGTIMWETLHTYRTLQCRACEAVSLMHIADYGGGNSNMEVVYYPSPVARKTPSWLNSVLFSRVDGSRHISDLLRETYAAVRGRQYRLAAMGVRSVLELLMVSKVGDKTTFGKNLEAFHEHGYISTIQYDAVKAILEAGHATTHRGFTPSEVDLNAMLDIVEGVVAAIMVHPKSATDLEQRVPPRRRK